MRRTTIYLELPDEGTPVWRQVDAEPVAGGVYRLLGEVPDDERWPFQPGDLVRCREKVCQGGKTELVACTLAGKQAQAPVRYRFVFDEPFLLAAFTHYRQQRKLHRILGAIKILGLVVTLTLSVYVLSYGKLFGALVLLAFALLIAFGQRIDNWRTCRRFRKSPYHNEEMSITLDGEGFHAVGGKSDSTLKWDAFTRVKFFADGILLFQGPGVFNWLPDTALEGLSPNEARQRVTEHCDGGNKNICACA